MRYQVTRRMIMATVPWPEYDRSSNPDLRLHDALCVSDLGMGLLLLWYYNAWEIVSSKTGIVLDQGRLHDRTEILALVKELDTDAKFAQYTRWAEFVAYEYQKELQERCKRAGITLERGTQPSVPRRMWIWILSEYETLENVLQQLREVWAILKASGRSTQRVEEVARFLPRHVEILDEDDMTVLFSTTALLEDLATFLFLDTDMECWKDAEGQKDGDKDDFLNNIMLDDILDTL